MAKFAHGQPVRIGAPTSPRPGHEYTTDHRGETGKIIDAWPRRESTEYYSVRLASGKLTIKHWDELERI